MAQAYKEGLVDPKIVSCRSEIAGIDARITDLRQQIRHGVPEERVMRYRRLAEQALEQFKAKNFEAAENLVAQQYDALHEAVVSEATENKIIALYEARRRIADTERKYEIATQGQMTYTQAASFFGALMTAIFEEVSNPNERAAIQRRAAAALGEHVQMPDLRLPPPTTELAVPHGEIEYIEDADDDPEAE